MFVSFCCVHLLGYHWDNVNKTALFVLVCIFKDHWHFSIEKELKIELHRHCNSNNGASYFRCASSHSSEGLHFKPTVLFLNWWICAGVRLSSWKLSVFLNWDFGNIVISILPFLHSCNSHWYLENIIYIEYTYICLYCLPSLHFE